jgi:hypothetical protein
MIGEILRLALLAQDGHPSPEAQLKVERGEARRTGRRVYRSQLRSCGGRASGAHRRVSAICIPLLAGRNENGFISIMVINIIVNTGLGKEGSRFAVDSAQCGAEFSNRLESPGVDGRSETVEKIIVLEGSATPLFLRI